MNVKYFSKKKGKILLKKEILKTFCKPTFENKYTNLGLNLTD